ncbi:MAG: hypothetical protein IJ193_02545 [Bacilli bacterium]|nr:hypothetical protein [Bacilli bacterium]
MKLTVSKYCALILSAGALITGKNAISSSIVESNIPVRGVTISSKEKVNWEKVSENFDYVYINVGDGLHDDEKFEENYENARKNKIDVGVVIDNQLGYSGWEKPSDMTKYAEYRYSHVKINKLMGKDIKYPIFLKIDYGDRPIEEALPKAYAEDLLNRYELILTHNKYIPGVYVTKENYEYLKNNIKDFDERFTVWIMDKEKKEECVSFSSISESKQSISDKEIDMIDGYNNVTETGVEGELGIASVHYSKLNYNHHASAIIPILFLGVEALGFSGNTIYKKRKASKEKSEKEKVIYL